MQSANFYLEFLGFLDMETEVWKSYWFSYPYFISYSYFILGDLNFIQ